MDINLNIYNIRSNVNTGVTSEPDTSTFPPTDEYKEIMYGYDSDSFMDLVFSPFNVHENSVDDDAPMIKGYFKKLNEKLDTLLGSSKSSSSAN